MEERPLSARGLRERQWQQSKQYSIWAYKIVGCMPSEDRLTYIYREVSWWRKQDQEAADRAGRVKN
jgi:hypothetical protein